MSMTIQSYSWSFWRHMTFLWQIRGLLATQIVTYLCIPTRKSTGIFPLQRWAGMMSSQIFRRLLRKLSNLNLSTLVTPKGPVRCFTLSASERKKFWQTRSNLSLPFLRALDLKRSLILRSKLLQINSSTIICQSMFMALAVHCGTKIQSESVTT